MRVKVFYHDKCFDGACSAALFSRFYRERIREHAEFEYTGLVHRAGALFNEERLHRRRKRHRRFQIFLLAADYLVVRSSPERLPDPRGRRALRAATLSNTKFYDPDYRSCTKFIADRHRERFGFKPAPVAEVIEWADIIDGALYADAKPPSR